MHNHMYKVQEIKLLLLIVNIKIVYIFILKYMILL